MHALVRKRLGGMRDSVREGLIVLLVVRTGVGSESVSCQNQDHRRLALTINHSSPVPSTRRLTRMPIARGTSIAEVGFVGHG